MQEWDLDKLLAETDGMENSETPPLAPAGESAMVSPDSGMSAQEPQTTESDAAEVDESSETTSTQPPPDEEVLAAETSAARTDLAAEANTNLRSSATGASPSADDDGFSPFPDSSAEDFSLVDAPPRSPEIEWPEIAPPENRQAAFLEMPSQQSRGSYDTYAEQAPAPQAQPIIQPVFNVQVTGGDDMVAKLGEEISPRLQQLQQQTEFYADDQIANYTDLMSLTEGGEF